MITSKNGFEVRRAESTLIATIMLMAITLFCMNITLSYVNSDMNRRKGESEFTLAKTYMRNIGLAVDDVVWHKGQMNTLQYSSEHAEIHLREGLIHYHIEIMKTGAGQIYNELNETRDLYFNALFYDLPITTYSRDDSYFEELLPDKMTDIVQSATTSPIVRVFALQRPARLGENNYISVGVVPLIRSIPYNLTAGIGASQDTQNYLRLYLANLEQGSATTANPRYITLIGGKFEATVIPDVRMMKITIYFPEESMGYNPEFFSFPSTTQIIDFGEAGTQLELYLGSISVGFL